MGANPSSLQAGVPPAQDADDDVQVLGSRAVRPANAPTPGSSAPRQTMIPPPAEAFAPAPRAPLAEADTNRPVEAPTTQAKKRTRGPKTSEPSPYLDVSSVTFNGEITNSVPIYDTCDTVRRKIRAALRRSDVTQAAFLRAISATYTNGRRVLSRGLNDFLAKKGALAGNKNYAYYAAYVFFEKVRIRDGKAKSEDREVMEWKWPQGVDTETDYTRRCVLVHKSARGAVTDKYGCLRTY